VPSHQLEAHVLLKRTDLTADGAAALSVPWRIVASKACKALKLGKWRTVTVLPLPDLIFYQIHCDSFVLALWEKIDLKLNYPTNRAKK
jgi:hypothetical protein